jgi:hypothetical protein
MDAASHSSAFSARAAKIGKAVATPRGIERVRRARRSALLGKVGFPPYYVEYLPPGMACGKADM